MTETKSEAKTRRTKRTDVHRPGALIPANYRPLLSYAFGGVRAWGSIRVNCESEIAVWNREGAHTLKTHGTGDCCVVRAHERAKAEGLAVFGSAGKCGVCGAVYSYGDIWTHTIDGALVHVGHECAAKYEILAAWPQLRSTHASLKASAATLIARAKRTADRARFLAKVEGLEQALTLDHHITRDIAARFESTGKISERQCDLLLKLWKDANAPKPAAEINVTAPTGKQTFTGRIVAAKWQEGTYGTQAKITVKVQTPNGAWLAWGTCPASMVPVDNLTSLRGRYATITADLKPGRDAHFALMSRPSGVLIDTTIPVAVVGSELHQEVELLLRGIEAIIALGIGAASGDYSMFQTLARELRLVADALDMRAKR